MVVLYNFSQAAREVRLGAGELPDALGFTDLLSGRTPSRGAVDETLAVEDAPITGCMILEPRAEP